PYDRAQDVALPLHHLEGLRELLLDHEETLVLRGAIVGYLGDEALSGGEAARLHAVLFPLRIDLPQQLTRSRPRGALPGFGRVADEAREEARWMQGVLDAEVRAGANQVSEGDEHVQEHGDGIRLGVGVQRIHDLTSKALKGLRR